ncbi:hypothetical protein PRZ48_014181 [Zasmidium cellare]|uniref:Uncharacterized protein n=1 Tax=Zasmidium cellare TaxID=395010 RepID=A0ABR0E095_ZASCE|nr:hypothetical protein PRZ48_014181 [Zasmidium cellare]
MAEDNQLAPCYLLALPPELRDIIYEYTFGSFEVDIDPSMRRERESHIQRCNASLVLTCRQTHAESIKAYYEHTLFCSYDDPKRLYEWIIQLPSVYRKALKHVKVKCFTSMPSNPDRVEPQEKVIRGRVSWELKGVDRDVPVEVEIYKLRTPWEIRA